MEWISQNIPQTKESCSLPQGLDGEQKPPKELQTESIVEKRAITCQMYHMYEYFAWTKMCMCVTGARVLLYEYDWEA